MLHSYKIQYLKSWGFLLVDLSAHTVFNFIQVTVWGDNGERTGKEDFFGGVA